MTNAAIQLSDTEASRMRGLLRENLTASRGGLATYHANIDSYRNYWLDVMPGDIEPYPGASMIVVPYIKNTAFVLAANILPNLLNIVPMLHWEDDDPVWRDAADTWEDYYQDQLILDNDSPFKQDFRRFFLNGQRDGAGIARVVWEVIELEMGGWDETVESVFDDYGQPVGQQIVREPGRQVQTAWEGPKLEVIDVKRFGTFPTSNANIRYSPGLWMQHPTTMDYLLAGMRRGTFDKDAVMQLLDASLDNSEAGSPNDTQQAIVPAQVLVQDPKKEGRNQELVLTEIIYRYSNGINKASADWQFVIEEKNDVMLCARPHPYWLRNGRRNIVSFSPFAGTGDIFNDSIASAGGAHIQHIKTELERVMVNVAKRKANPRSAIPASMWKQLSNFRRREFQKDGAFVPISDILWQSGMRAADLLFQEGGDPLVLLPILQYIDLEGDRLMHTSDADRNAALSNETATATRQKEGAKTRLAGLVREHAAEALQDIGEIIHDLTRQYQDRPVVQQRWAKVSAKRSINIPLESAVERPLRVEANGLTRTMNDEVESARAMAVYDIAMKEPRVVGNETRRHNTESVAMQKIGKERNPDDILGTAEEWEQEKQQEQRQMMQAQQQAMEMQAQAQGQQAQGQERESQAKQVEGERKEKLDLAKLAAPFMRDMMVGAGGRR